MRSRVLKGRLLPVVLALGTLAVSVTVGGATAGGGHRHARDVTSKVDAAVAQKLSPDLQQQVDADATAPVKVVVSLQASSLPQATDLLQDTHVASKNNVALLIGTVNAAKLGKLASLKGVVAVSLHRVQADGHADRQRPRGREPAGPANPERRARGLPEAFDPLRQGAPAQGLQLRPAEEPERARREDPRLHGRVEGRLHRHGRHRLRARRRHRLGPPGPDRDVADLEPGRRHVVRSRSRLGRLAEGVRPVLDARASERAGHRCAGALLVHGDAGRAVHVREAERPARQEDRPEHALLGQLRHPDRPGAELRRPGRHPRPHVHVPGELVEVRHGQADQPPGRVPARSSTASGPRFSSPTRTRPASTTRSTSI